MIWQSEAVFARDKRGTRLRRDHAKTISTDRVPPDPTEKGTGPHNEGASEQVREMRKAAWQRYEKLMFNQK
jgi:hypothetical protein